MAVCSRRTSTHQRVCKQCGLQGTRRVESRWRLILASGLSSTKKEGAFTSVFLDMTYDLAQAIRVCQRKTEGFAAFSWHSEGGTPRHKALMAVVVWQARTTKHPWLVACDATTDPEDFQRGLWFKREVHVHGAAGSKSNQLSCHRFKWRIS